MNTKCSDIFRLRMSDFDCYDNLTPFAVLDLFQDIAGKHSKSYGLDYDSLKKDNMIWVIVRSKFEILDKIPLHSSVLVSTWPKKKGLVDFDRELLITSLDGLKIYAKGISKWVILDWNKRTIIPAKKLDFEMSTPDTFLFNDKFDKLLFDDSKITNEYTYSIDFDDFDHNNHVNNARYSIMVSNALNLKENEIIKNFQMDFLKEVTNFGNITIKYYKENGSYYLKGIKDNANIFVCKVSI